MKIIRLREYMQDSRSARLAVDRFLTPASLWALVGVAVGYLVEDGPILGTRLMISVVLFAMIVLDLEVGIKRHYVTGRRKYFYLVFLPPTVLTIGLLVASLVMPK